jgi:hypothetical protein
VGDSLCFSRNSKLKTENNKKLLPKIETLCENEEDNGVKKKYLDAIKKVKNVNRQKNLPPTSVWQYGG